MGDIENSAATHLQQFEEQNSPAGLLRRYAQGRVRNFKQRQVLTVLGSAFLGAFLGPYIGIATLMLAITGEAIDCLYLAWVLRRADFKKNTNAFATGALFAGIFQAFTISACVILTWFAGQSEARFFAMVFLSGAMLNAGLVLFFYKKAALARLIVYGVCAGFVLTWDIYNGQWDSREFWFDVFSTGMLLYLIILFIIFTNAYQKRRQKFEHELIRERQNTENANAALAKKERHFRWLAAVAENANDSVVISNPDRTIEWVNDAFSEMTGYSFSEAIGKNPGALLNGPESSQQVTQDIIDALEAKRPIRTEIINYTKGGSTIWVETSISPIFDENGKLTMFIGIERDITTNKQREEELAIARVQAEQAVVSKSAFLATMSHEIRTPMNGVIGMADLLYTTKLDFEQKELTKTIIESGESLLHIINDILDFSKLGSGKLTLSPTPVSVVDLVSRATESLRSIALEKHIGLSIEHAEKTAPIVMCDPVRLRQITLNLVGNAIKFTADGGVTVQIDETEVPDGVEITLRVRDTGIGIADSAIEKIFENFTQADGDTTRKFGGTGLGLSISQGLIRQMGGEISVASTLGQGSCFKAVFVVPKARPDQIKAAENESHAKDQAFQDFPPDKNILIAEDNKTNRLLIKKMFKGVSANLCFATNGDEAVEFFKTFNPDIVLMDVSMPIKNGLQATQEIRAYEISNGLFSSPIIALTANAFAEDQRRCMDAGMNGFLSKPVKQSDLMGAISKAI